MNLNHLAVFHAVAEAGSVSGGAERLMISQPAVSKQLKELERALKTVLFDRLPKGVKPTEAGTLLAGYARRLFAVEAEAERAMAELGGLQRGKLIVGASTTVGAYLLPPVLARLRTKHPGLQIQLEIANTAVIQEQLLEGRLDVGLIEGFVNSPELESEVFQMDELVAIVPANHPLTAKRGKATAEQLCREPLILREPGSGTREVVQHALAGKGLRYDEVMSLGSTEAIKRAVAAGVGVAIVSKLTIEPETKLGTLVIVPLADLTIQRPLHRLLVRDHHPSRATLAFLEELKTASPHASRKK